MIARLSKDRDRGLLLSLTYAISLYLECINSIVRSYRCGARCPAYVVHESISIAVDCGAGT